MEIIYAGSFIVDYWLKHGIIKEVDGKYYDLDGDEVRRNESRAKEDK